MTLMCVKWRRACDPYAWEVEKATWPLRVGSGEGHVTIVSGKEYGVHSESAWNRK
jgi:hypothetical protein